MSKKQKTKKQLPPFKGIKFSSNKLNDPPCACDESKEVIPSLPDLQNVSLSTAQKLMKVCDFPMETGLVKSKGGGKKVNLKIALLDTGVNDHTELPAIERMNWKGETDPAKDIHDQHGHGTHNAGILIGKGPNIIGIANGASLVSVKITDNNSSSTSWFRIVKGLDQVKNYNKTAKEKITAVNLSFNGFDNLRDDIDMRSHKLYKLIAELWDENIPVMVSAGNGFRTFLRKGLAYPANCSKVISAGSVYGKKFGQNQPDDIYTGTQRTNKSIDSNATFLLVPGVNSVSTSMDGMTFSFLSGSSQAACVLSGCVLLMQKKYRESKGMWPDVVNLQHTLLNAAKNINNLPSRISNLKLKSYMRNPLFYDEENYKRLDIPNSISLI